MPAPPLASAPDTVADSALTGVIVGRLARAPGNSATGHEKDMNMRRFFVWDVGARAGKVERDVIPQTPELVADEVENDLLYPPLFTEGPRFAMGVQPLPEGIERLADLPDDDPEQHRYMQAAGSELAMTIETRVPDPAYGYIHYVLAREPVVDPSRWVPFSWDNGSKELITVQLHPEEIFTGQQAVPVFRNYILNGQIPPAYLLRRLDI